MGDNRHEDASELRLGPEFENETCLSNAEVLVLLENVKKEYEEKEKILPDIIEETMRYCRRFSQIKEPSQNKAGMEQLRDELEKLEWPAAKKSEDEGTGDETVKLTQFEMVCAMNLNLEDAEEAMTHIPSLLYKIPQDGITDVLNRINRATGRYGAFN